MPAPEASREAHVAAVARLPKLHMRADFVLCRQAGRRHERIVARVDHQRRNADPVQLRLGRTALPVVVGVAKAVQRRGEDIVERVQVARREQRARDRTGPGCCASLASAFGFIVRRNMRV
jgi:hypothetical protein